MSDVTEDYVKSPRVRARCLYPIYFRLYSTLLLPVRGGGVYTPHYYSLCGVMEFILHIITPCTGWWSLYSTLLISERGRGVCSLVNRETLLDLKSELRSDALPATMHH